LENALVGFPGAVIVITHDRYLLDRICTELVGLHAEGRWGRYASVAQWQEATAHRKHAREAKKSAASPQSAPSGTSTSKSGLTYQEKREFAGMEERILEAESVVETLMSQLEDPAVAADHTKLQELYEAHREAKDQLDRLFARWEELERKSIGE